MNNQLMAIKVEVDPLGARTSFFQAKHFTVKGACASEVVNRDCEVERREAHQNSNDSIFVGEGRSSVSRPGVGFERRFRFRHPADIGVWVQAVAGGWAHRRAANKTIKSIYIS
jgi:hypothetical protein